MVQITTDNVKHFCAILLNLCSILHYAAGMRLWTIQEHLDVIFITKISLKIYQKLSKILFKENQKRYLSDEFRTKINPNLSH